MENSDERRPRPRAVVELPVPEIRDYIQINRRVTQLLDTGASHIRLVGVERQRLLIAGLRGAWRASIEIDGHAGPEVAAELDAPNLFVVVQGGAADGAGRGLRQGTLAINGPTDAGAGYSLRGGLIAIAGVVGPRAGLEQQGGCLIVFGNAGPLAGERQGGGALVLARQTTSLPGLGRSRRGGLLESPGAHLAGTTDLSTPTREALERLAAQLAELPEAPHRDPLERALGKLGFTPNRAP